MIHFIRLTRPQQWIKNLFILIPAFFAGNLLDAEVLYRCIIGIISFSLVASSIYVLNDLKDVKMDRLHPVKKFRPIASNQVRPTAAIFITVLYCIAGISIAFLLDQFFAYIVTGYFILNLGYCFGLKKISVLDMIIVAFGFVLRTVGGGFLADVEISKWLLIMIFLLSFFLAIAKRRDDILLYEKSGVSVRRSVEKYNLDFINSAMTMLSTIIIVSYLMYTVSEEAIQRMGFEHLYLTSIFVLAGIIRYLQIALVENNSASPVRILYTDRFIQLILVLWVASFAFIIYSNG